MRDETTPKVVGTRVSSASALQAAEEIAQPLGVALDIFLRDLENAGAQLAHHADQLADLVPVRETARDRAAVGRLDGCGCARC